MLIVEDDPYGSLYFDDVATAGETRPIRADDANGRVLYLSTLSKTLAPGFRVGWMVAPPALIERFDTAKQSTDLTSGILDQRIVVEALRRGVVDRLAPRLRELYRRKRDVMEAAIREQHRRPADVVAAQGWLLHLGDAADGLRDVDVLERALEHGVVFVDRQRLSRGRQRPRHHPPVVLRADARPHRRRRPSSARRRLQPALAPSA